MWRKRVVAVVSHLIMKKLTWTEVTVVLKEAQTWTLKMLGVSDKTDPKSFIIELSEHLLKLYINKESLQQKQELYNTWREKTRNTKAGADLCV